MVESSSSTKLPAWLESLLSEKFFNACMIHEDAKKNEKNIFCLDCCEAICHHCFDYHNSHRLLKIRRYLYHDVIKVGDAEKLMEISHVQAYTTTNAKVMFLNPRPQTRGCKNLSNNCVNCDRGLQDPFLFSSISCKIDHIMRNEGMISKYLHECKVLTMSKPGSDEWLMTPDSVLEPFASISSSTGIIDRLTIACTTNTEFVRKKRTPKYEIPAAVRGSPTPPPIETTSNRHKGLPCRSPIC